ncbi:MAG: dihydrolipoyl dehydrogenase [Actinomycetaceae bacterium]|nr:dihydrolipoyl dehydrogenase [Actinomycetaceae bacterium]MDY6082741.1 dihydrolipoyl dehydrogenase [Actinomycetaceae bacterium]
MAEENQYDVIIIGSGPGGYVAAIRAAQLGLKTAIVEELELGGVCLNRGCVPTKALIHVSRELNALKDADAFGVTAGSVTLDEAKMDDFKKSVVDTQTSGVGFLMKSNKIDVYHAHATITGAQTVALEAREGDMSGALDVPAQITASKGIVIATGAVPVMIPIPGIEYCVSSDDLLEGKERPEFESITIIGGGVIGVELATFYAGIGKQVTLVEALDRVLAKIEKDASTAIVQQLKAQGASVNAKSSVQRVEKLEDGRLRTVFTDKKGKEQSADSDYVLCAVGRKANIDGLFAEGMSVETDRGGIVVNDKYETSVPGIWAIGDVHSGSSQLAHAASFEAEQAVEEIAGGSVRERDQQAIPAVVYTWPEYAHVGMTEEEAKAAGHDVLTGKFPLGGNAMAVVEQSGRSFMKTIFDAETEELLGVTMLANRASDMIDESTMAIANHMTFDQMLRGMRPHPTYMEGFTEALLAAKGEAIHMAPAKK